NAFPVPTSSDIAQRLRATAQNGMVEHLALAKTFISSVPLRTILWTFPIQSVPGVHSAKFRAPARRANLGKDLPEQEGSGGSFRQHANFLDAQRKRRLHPREQMGRLKF